MRCIELLLYAAKVNNATLSAASGERPVYRRDEFVRLSSFKDSAATPESSSDGTKLRRTSLGGSPPHRRAGAVRSDRSRESLTAKLTAKRMDTSGIERNRQTRQA